MTASLSADRHKIQDLDTSEKVDTLLSTTPLSLAHKRDGGVHKEVLEI